MCLKKVCHPKNCLYLLAISCLILATLIYDASLGAPWWIYEKSDPHVHRGIFYDCFMNRTCMSVRNSNSVDMIISRSLMLTGAVGLITSILSAIYYNCRQPYSRQPRLLGVYVLITGCISVSGTLVYLFFNISTVLSDEMYKFSWAFYINLFGGTLSIFAAILFFNIRKPYDIASDILTKSISSTISVNEKSQELSVLPTSVNKSSNVIPFSAPSMYLSNAAVAPIVVPQVVAPGMLQAPVAALPVATPPLLMPPYYGANAIAATPMPYVQNTYPANDTTYWQNGYPDMYTYPY